VNKNRSEIYSVSSIFWSAFLSLLPPTLYFAAEWQSGVVEMLLVAAFFTSIAALFFLAIWYSHKIAALALLRWIFESFAVFGRGYRLHFYGLLALCGGIIYLFRAAKLLAGA
jgi:hypothetical protein